MLRCKTCESFRCRAREVGVDDEARGNETREPGSDCADFWQALICESLELDRHLISSLISDRKMDEAFQKQMENRENVTESTLGPYWLDRLVYGELSEAEQQRIVSTLDHVPDGWKRCALGFLESQIWRRGLKDWKADVSLTTPPVQTLIKPAVNKGASAPDALDWLVDSSDFHGNGILDWQLDSSSAIESDEWRHDAAGYKQCRFGKCLPPSDSIASQGTDPIRHE